MTESVEEAVKRTLLTFGIDVGDPIAAQEQAAAMRSAVKLMADPEFQKDLAAVRAWRETQDTAKKAGLVALIGAAMTLLIAALGWLARAAMLYAGATQHPPPHT